MIKGLLFQQYHHQPPAPMEENLSNLTSASGDASVCSGNPSDQIAGEFSGQQYLSPPRKKKRNLPGNPDPDAEVIALSPKTLLATNRFICEICNKGFQRDQNLQLHRRGHNLPWKLKQRPKNEPIRKKVYVCPEASCVHHTPARALGDLTGIKKHYCRKHGEKKWKCEKCSKRYAVQSDWKAHSKTCGTREYRCDCGTLFSRRDSFITHRAFCDALAEESARTSITSSNPNPPLLPQTHHPSLSPPLPPSFSHLNFQNPLQQQQQTQSFSLQKDQNFPFLSPEIPPWLLPSRILPSDHHPQDHYDADDHQTNQNPNNNNNNNPYGPHINPNSEPHHHLLLLPPYQSVISSSPHMSATALLQKAAQMGATMSSDRTPAQQVMSGTRVSESDVSSSRDDLPMGAAGVINSRGFETYRNKPVSLVSPVAGSEGMTRDFLGLRAFSDADFFNIAGLSNCMNGSQNPAQEPWEG